MPHPSSRSTVLVVALLLGVLAGACSDDASPSSAATSTSGRPATTDEAATTTEPAAGAAPSTPAAAGTPVAGDCIEPVTPTSAEGPQLPALVPCTDPHGGEIVAVSTLTDPPDAAYPAVGDLTGDAATALATCRGDGGEPSTFDAFVGDNRLESPAGGGQEAGAHQAWIVSSIEAVLFVPGPAAWSHGERWAACAAVVRNNSSALSSYEGSAKGLRTPGKLTDALAWCRTEEDAEGSFDVVACSGPHSLEQVASFRVAGDQEGYPGNDQIDDLAGRLCPGLTSTATSGRSDSASKADYGISWTFPREEDWGNGDRTGRCYMRSINAPTTGTFAAGTA